MDVIRVAADGVEDPEPDPEPEGGGDTDAVVGRRTPRKLFARFSAPHPLHNTQWRQRLAVMPRVPVYSSRGCPPWPGLEGKAADRQRWASFIMANLVPWHHGAAVDLSWEAYIHHFEGPQRAAHGADGLPATWTELSCRDYVRRLKASSLPDKPNQLLVHAARTTDRKCWGIPHALDVAFTGGAGSTEGDYRIAVRRQQGMVLYQAVLRNLQEQLLAAVVGARPDEGGEEYPDSRVGDSEADPRAREIERLWTTGLTVSANNASSSNAPARTMVPRISEMARAHVLPGMYNEIRLRYAVPFLYWLRSASQIGSANSIIPPDPPSQLFSVLNYLLIFSGPIGCAYSNS
ncbi:MAG: hypothetical protein ACP5I8_13740 [Phycisphaerae bacterium]